MALKTQVKLNCNPYSFLVEISLCCSSCCHRHSGFLSVLGLTLQLSMLVVAMLSVFCVNDACSDC